MYYFLTLQTHLKLPSVLTHSSLKLLHVTISCLHSSTSMHLRALVSSSSSTILKKFSNWFIIKFSKKHTFSHSRLYKRIHTIQLYSRILFQISTLEWIQWYLGVTGWKYQFKTPSNRNSGPGMVTIQKHIHRHLSICLDHHKNPNHKCMKNFQNYFDM